MVFGWISRFSLRTSDIHRPYSGLSTILVPNHFPSYPFPLRKGIFTKLLYPIGYSRSPTLRLYFVNRSKTIHYLIYEAGNWNCDLRQSVQNPSSCLFTLIVATYQRIFSSTITTTSCSKFQIVDFSEFSSYTERNKVFRQIYIYFSYFTKGFSLFMIALFGTNY